MSHFGFRCCFGCANWRGKCVEVFLSTSIFQILFVSVFIPLTEQIMLYVHIFCSSRAGDLSTPILCAHYQPDDNVHWRRTRGFRSYLHSHAPGPPACKGQQCSILPRNYCWKYGWNGDDRSARVWSGQWGEQRWKWRVLISFVLYGFAARLDLPRMFLSNPCRVEFLFPFYHSRYLAVCGYDLILLKTFLLFLCYLFAFPLQVLCSLPEWVFSVWFSLTFASLFAKNGRIHKVRVVSFYYVWAFRCIAVWPSCFERPSPWTFLYAMRMTPILSSHVRCLTTLRMKVIRNKGHWSFDALCLLDRVWLGNDASLFPSDSVK